MPLTAIQGSWLLPLQAGGHGGAGGEEAVVGCVFMAPGFERSAHREALPGLRLAGHLNRSLAVAGSSKLQLAVTASHPVSPVPIDSVTPRVTRLGLPELLSSLASKQKKGGLQPGTVCVKQVICDKRALSAVVLAQVDTDDATGKPVAKIAAVAVCASASQARAVQEALRNLPTASSDSAGGVPGPAPHGLFGPNLFPDAAAQGSPLRGLEGPMNVSGQGDFDNMSDFGDDVTKGAKSQQLVRVLVHANPSEV